MEIQVRLTPELSPECSCLLPDLAPGPGMSVSPMLIFPRLLAPGF